MKIIAYFNDGSETLVEAPTFVMARIAAKDRFPELHVVHIETYSKPLQVVEV